jgi:Fe-S cluster assembly protein SufD
VTVTKTIPYRSTFLTQEAEDAWKYFQETGYPDSKNENWRFSNPTPWLNLTGDIITNSNIEVEFSSHIIPNSIPIFIINDKLILPQSIPDDIQIINFNTKYRDSKVGKDFFGKVKNYYYSPFVAENTALFQNFISINIVKDTKLDHPIHLIHLVKEKSRGRMFPRIHVNIGSGSEVEIWKTETGMDNNSHFINSVTEIILHENAHLKWINCQKLNHKTGNFSFFDISLKKDATAEYNSFEFGGGFIRSDIHTHFDSNGGDCEINSLFVSNGSQHVDISTLVHHKKPHCFSRQIIKGILGSYSTAVFRGLANVYKEAEKTNAQQNNDNLILSPNARVNSIPQLEINADDVKCSHGSTTGQIEEEALFYLQSRGINRTDAMGLMVRGFANEVVNKVENQDMKEYIQNSLIKKMEGMIQ